MDTHKRHRLNRIFAVADQGLQGVASIVATALLGRALPTSEFASIGVMVGLYYFVVGFHRNGVILPYITEDAGAHGDDKRYHSDWWWLSIVAALLIQAALAGVGGTIWLASHVEPGWRWLLRPIMLAVIITPPLLTAEHTRRWLFQIGRADLVALASVLFFTAMISVAGYVSFRGGSALDGAMAWVAGGLASTLVALLALRPGAPSWRRSIACWKRNTHFALWQSLNHLPYTAYSNATVVIPIGIFIGPQAAAVFTAARTLTNPAISLVSAVDSTDKPRAARALHSGGLAGMRRSVNRTRRLLLLLCGAYLLPIAIFAEMVVRWAFHGRYAGIEDQVRLLALAFFMMCLNQPSETFLIVLRANRALFGVRVAAATVTLLGLWFARSSGAAGMAIVLVVTQSLNMAFLLSAEFFVSRYRTSRLSAGGAETAPPDVA